jgi:hypothetical protein
MKLALIVAAIILVIIYLIGRKARKADKDLSMKDLKPRYPFIRKEKP